MLSGEFSHQPGAWLNPPVTGAKKKTSELDPNHLIVMDHALV